MKQFALLTTATMVAGVLAPFEPFWGLLLYYGLATLRPQYVWDWALPVDVRWSLIAALIVLGSTALNLHRVFTRTRLNLIAVLILVFGVLLLMSMLTAYNPHTAQQWGIEYAKVLLIAFIACLLIDQLWQLRAMALMILLTLGYLAWGINSMYLFENYRLDIFHYGYGGLDNNGAGLMLAMGVPVAYAFGVGAAGRWRWGLMAAAGVLGLLLLHAIMLSYSRGAMLACAVGGAWLLLHHRPRWQVLWLVLALVIVLPVLAGPEIRDRFTSIAQYHDDPSAQSRLDSWQAAWTITWDEPLLGKGIRNSNHFSYNFGADRQGRTIHNQYLQIAADSGIPAALCYVAILALAVWRFSVARRICFEALARRSLHDDGGDDRGDPAVDELREAEKLCLGLQTSLLTFAFAATFLSVELVELPWLIVVLGGAAPLAIERRIAQLDGRTENESDAEPEPTEPEPAAPPHRPRIAGATT